MDRAPDRNNYLIGVGLDAGDGHKRITQGEAFSIVGGSEETHDRLTETVIKTSEELSTKGRTIRDADPEEIRDLVMKHSS